MILDRLSETEAEVAVLKAFEATLAGKSLCTRDVGSPASRAAAGAAIPQALASIDALA